jgi:hypothetical protein
MTTADRSRPVLLAAARSKKASGVDEMGVAPRTQLRHLIGTRNKESSTSQQNKRQTPSSHIDRGRDKRLTETVIALKGVSLEMSLAPYRDTALRL